MITFRADKVGLHDSFDTAFPLALGRSDLNSWKPQKQENCLSDRERGQLREFVAANLDRLVLYARTRCSSPEDAVQEALVELVRQPTLPADLMKWLFQAVRWRAENLRRAEARQSTHIEAHARTTSEWFAGPDHSLGAGFDADDLQSALQDLPDLEREIVVLKVWSGHTFDEIAEIVDASRSRVHRQYWSAVRRLKRSLQMSDDASRATSPRTTAFIKPTAQETEQ